MRLVATVGALVLCAKLLAQAPATLSGAHDTAPSPSEKFPAEWYLAQDPYHPSPVAETTSGSASSAGAPFIGTIVMSASLPGQTPRVATMREFTMRDSAGRLRTEEEFNDYGRPISNASQVMRQISVNDVVAHCSFDWVEPATKESDKRAIVQCFPRRVASQVDGVECKQPDSEKGKRHDGPEIRQPDGMESKMTRQVPEVLHDFPWETLQIEPLGQKIIAGLTAFGIRQTLINTQVNAGQPQVTEIWWSPKIKEILKATPIGDTLGRMATEMTDINLKEPDPALFYPPIGYKIVTGALPF